MSAFGDAFKKARKKFEKSGSAGDYVFEHNGKKYSILKKGETKKGVMKKFSAPAKSLKPKLRPRLDDLKDSGIKMSKLPPAGLKKTNRMDNPPPDLKRTAKLRTPKTTGDGTGDPYNSGRTKVPEKRAPKPEKNKGGPVTKKPKGAYAAGGMAAKKKKPAAKKMMAGGMTKKSGYMYGGMAKKKAKK